MHVSLTWAGTPHMLVGMMSHEDDIKYFLHVANMQYLQLFI